MRNRPVTAEEMRAHAKRLHERADRLVDTSWNRMTSVPSPMITGSSGYARNFGRKNSRNIAAFENAGAKAKALREAAGKWLYRADQIDPEKMVQRAKAAEVKAQVKATIEDFMRDTLKPGDLIYVGGNSPLEVKRVNKKSVTADSGTNWTYDEISTHKTGTEMIAAFKAWRDAKAA